MDTRSMKILSAIVDEYIRTGEPVGSKALAEKPDISVSSATIRNTMAALEQEGYLDHPHTSAGRVPTYKGYRFYTCHRLYTCNRHHTSNTCDRRYRCYRTATDFRAVKHSES